MAAFDRIIEPTFGGHSDNWRKVDAIIPTVCRFYLEIPEKGNVIVGRPLTYAEGRIDGAADERQAAEAAEVDEPSWPGKQALISHYENILATLLEAHEENDDANWWDHNYKHLKEICNKD